MTTPTPRFRFRPCGVGLLCAAAAAFGLALAALAAQAEEVSGDAVVRSLNSAHPIVLTTTARLAGAIHSLTWNGREFIDSADHGRQLQSALNADAGSPIQAETFNPTEAGSRRDGAGPHSTSRLLHLIADGHVLQSTTQMAYWLAPGETSGGQPAKNSTRLSNHLLTKRIRIGVEGEPQLLQYDVTFSLPVDEQHRQVVFESLTGYMPPEFSVFWRFDPQTQRLVPLSDGPGEQSNPVVLATPDGAYAMGVYGLPAAEPRLRGPTYGRFRFTAERVVKWNCVYRWNGPDMIPAGEYSFSLRVAVGSTSEVERLLQKLQPAQSSGTRP